MWCSKILLLFISINCIFGRNFQPNQSTYRAGVVEYYPAQDKDFNAKVQKNLEAYVKFIEEAKEEHEVDILVFPEATINGGITNRINAATQTIEVKPSSKINQDHQLPPVLETISTKAKENRIYVVVNLYEKELCQTPNEDDDRPCATDGWNFYNTDLVFDRNGNIIARYRKYNLFGEKPFNTTKNPEHSTFTTDFGVRFGLFTCFDILFTEPTLTLVREGIKNFVFPAMWYSGIPFLTALQVQEYWSFSNDVNLLAAGASNTLYGSGGSGIYAGRKGPIVSYISVPRKNGEEYKNNKLLVADVPILDGNGSKVLKNRNVSEMAQLMDKFTMIKDNLSKYSSEEINTPEFSKEICNKDLCCTFTISSTFLNKTGSSTYHYRYRVVVGDVIRSFSGVTTGGIKACGVVACSGDTIETCGARFNDSSKVEVHQVFNQIHVEGRFPNIKEVLTMPNTLSLKMRPLDQNRFLYQEDKNFDDGKLVKMDFKGVPEEELFAFAIYGRDFRYDGL